MRKFLYPLTLAAAIGALVVTLALPDPDARAEDERGLVRVEVAGQCRRDCRDQFPETAPRGDLG